MGEPHVDTKFIVGNDARFYLTALISVISARFIWQHFEHFDY